VRRLSEPLAHLLKQPEEEGKESADATIVEIYGPLDVGAEAAALEWRAGTGQIVGPEDGLVETLVVKCCQGHVEAMEAGAASIVTNDNHTQGRKVECAARLELRRAGLGREGDATAGEHEELALHRDGLRIGELRVLHFPSNGSVKIGSVNSIRFENTLPLLSSRNRPQSNTESVMSGMCEAVIP